MSRYTNRGSVWSIAYELLGMISSFGKARVKYDVYESSYPANIEGSELKPPEPANISASYTAMKVLSDAISQLPIELTKEGVPEKDSKLYYALRYRMNQNMSNQAFWSTLEIHRNSYGNAFVDIRRKKNEIIHPALVIDFDFKGPGGELRFKIDWGNSKKILGTDKFNKGRQTEWVRNSDLLHFKGVSTDGVFGLSPVAAAALNMTLLDKSTNTIISFYQNSAMSPMALESTIDSSSAGKATLEGLGEFNKKYTGTWNHGKTIQLPPNTKLTPLQIKFGDAQLLETLRFSRDEIFSLYNIPKFMYSNEFSNTMEIEQQTLQFKTFTLASITAAYKSEMEFKLLSKQELLDGVEIDMDLDVLVTSDLKTKANAFKVLVQAGILTPNHAIEKMGYQPVDNEWLDYHYQQTQMLPIELYERNPLMQKSIEGGGTAPEENPEEPVKPDASGGYQPTDKLDTTNPPKGDESQPK